MLDNRLSAIKICIDSLGIENIKYFVVMSIRYEGGYYATYLFSKTSSVDLDILEYSGNLRSIRVYAYNSNSQTLVQVKEL